MQNAPNGTRRISSLAGVVLGLFFVSGALGLIYEVIWLRMLILIFGSTHFATTTVLTAFMAGLALGAYLFGRLIDRRWEPVRVYGLLEIGIGVYALLVPFLFEVLLPVSRWLWASFAPTFYVFSLLRFAFVSVVLILPCALMGATLPVLSRFVAGRGEAIGFSVGTLYGVNTFGAVVGTAGTGFLIIPLLGVQRSIYVAASLNILLGLAAILFARAARPETPPPASASALEAARAPLPRQIRLVLLAFGVSGFVAMIYEIAWTRVLALVIGSSVYAFTVMLATFLIGLAGGASLMSRLADRLGGRWGMEGIATIMAATGATAFGTLLFFHSLPYFFSLAFHGIHTPDAAGHEQVLLFSLQFLIAGIVMLPPTLFLGGMFPLVVRICGEALPLVGRSVGTAYASNTVGTIFGSALGGFAVLPLLGIQGSIILAIVMNLLLAALLMLGRPGARSRVQVLAVAACLVGGVGAWALQPKWNALLMNSGVYQYAADMSETDLTREGFYQYTQGDFDLRFYKEGVTATVMVAGERTTKDIWLSVNGKIDASSYGDIQTQILSGHLPALLADRWEDVVVIGYASGMTVGSVTQYDIRSLTAVEIEPAIIEASEQFKEHNHDPLSNPLVRIVTADGRNFLLVTPERYDIIISEPSNPWMTVASNLFTREFFEVGRSRLRQGGVFCQWLQLYGMRPDDLKALSRTFASVFPHVLVFNTIPDADLVLLGSDRPLRFDLERMLERMSMLDVALDLGRVRVFSPHDVLTYFMMGTKELREFAGEGPLNTDDNALIEFRAPRSLHFETRRDNIAELRRHVADPLDYVADAPRAPELRAAQYQFLAEAYMRRAMDGSAKKAIADALALHDTEEGRLLQQRIRDAAEERARKQAS